MQHTDPSSLTQFFSLDIDHQAILHTLADQICGKPVKISRPEGINVIEFSDASLLLKTMIQKAIRENLTSKKIRSDFTENYPISAENVEVIIEVLQSRKEELRSIIANDSLNLVSDAYLDDFDWKVHVVVASSQMSKQRVPLLILLLYITDANKRRREVMLELTQTDLDLLLNTFSKIKSTMQEYTTNTTL